MGGCGRPVTVADGEDIPSGDLWRNWQISASGYAGVWAREILERKFLMLLKERKHLRPLAQG